MPAVVTPWRYFSNPKFFFSLKDNSRSPLDSQFFFVILLSSFPNVTCSANRMEIFLAPAFLFRFLCASLFTVSSHAIFGSLSILNVFVSNLLSHCLMSLHGQRVSWPWCLVFVHLCFALFLCLLPVKPADGQSDLDILCGAQPSSIPPFEPFCSCSYNSKPDTDKLRPGGPCASR